ncbi:hypothetical protein TVAG_474750 [Trichomonas vaginalis G3]|uniref:Amino acid transporter transmembrane domain-containing protein n=1 Tax=Trichomonas vaginalis (strain ATCC PRA-98 / G3) TaxID=412133 RepID=A2ERM5_TRIV3|nr:hypothetical protein TVAGG3_0345090 [Trichomonas vaginalis G3]EAY04677.1 hypothetical protein TVAG_474750 [Trichomonas vaginalis G3]KAI5530914.1 hypothetical protein TVAGG3_0345090 [Trichomonas vaginalis G3]|eukprot:XP_001316900.1 hypothetical protein [Trichomonas vaginalis G3]
MVAIPEIVKRAIPFIACTIEIIATASCFYMYDHIADGHSSTVASGYSPKHYKVNLEYYSLVSLFMFGMISLIMAIAELGLVFMPQYFKFVDSTILRAVIYILTGVAIIGTSADLGIAAGSMQFIIATVMIIIYLLENGINCK